MTEEFTAAHQRLVREARELLAALDEKKDDTAMGKITKQEKADYRAAKEAGTLGPKHGVRKDVKDAAKALRDQRKGR